MEGTKSKLTSVSADHGLSVTKKKNKSKHGAQTRQECILLEMPLEVLEMIVGKLSILDLPNFLLCCRRLKSMFEATCYNSQLKVIVKYESNILGDMCKQFQWNHERCTWRVHEVLKAFIDTTCHDCGGYAAFYQWIRMPPRKLCLNCVGYRDNCCVLLDQVLGELKLPMKDFEHIPIVKLMESVFRYTSGTAFALQEDIREIAVTKMSGDVLSSHLDRMLDLADHAIILGIAGVGQLDPISGLSFEPLRCGGCQLPSEDSSESFPMILHNYESLHQHIASAHPKVLNDFELGWSKLGQTLQEEWLAKGRRKEGDMPFIYEKNDPHDRPTIFDGWTKIVMDELLRQHVTKDIRWHRHAQTIKDIIIERQSHSGSLLGIPILPEFGDESIQTRMIATVAADAIIDAGLTNVVKQFEQDMEANGLNAMHKYLVPPLLFEER